MERITKRHLTAIVDRLNRITGNAGTPYTLVESGQYRANIGNYHLSGAYGGHALYQMVNEGGAVRDVLHSGHVPARDLYHRMHAFMKGMESAPAREVA
jgi:hypothetical protein